MWERMLADAKKVGADTILFRLYDGHDWKYQNHIVTVYFLCGDFEIAHYQPADIAGMYLGCGYPEIKFYRRLWGKEIMRQYKRISINQ